MHEQSTPAAADQPGADLDAAQASLLARLASRYGSTPRTLHSTDMRYPYSRVRRLRLDCGDDRLELFLKRIVPGRAAAPHAAARLQNEGEILVLLNERMPGRSAPFVAAFPERLVLITGACSGAPFERELFAAGLRRWPPAVRRVARISAACGAWLGDFQALTGDAGIDLADWVRLRCHEVRWREADLVQLDPRNAPLYRDCAARLQEDFLRCPLPRAGCRLHGDFAPHNIFVDADHRVQVLDFFASRTGYPLADVANYLGKVASFAEDLVYSTAVARKACAAFLDGYRGIESAERPVFRLLVVEQALKRSLSLLEARSQGGLRARLHGRPAWYLACLASYAKAPGLSGPTRSPWPFLELTGLP